jgi:molecular chaperone DnaK
MIHATRSAIGEHGSKVPGEQLAAIETALADLETAMKGDDKAQIEARTGALQQAAQSLYAVAAGGGQAPQDDDGASAGRAGGDDVVDAEFTEVRDDDRKA